MDSKEARGYVRTAGCECQGTTRKALDIVLSDSEKLEQIEKIINRTEGTLGLDNYIVQQIKEVLNG